MRILLVDNDIESLQKLRAGIDDHYIVDVANNGEEGAYLSQANEYSAIVLESGLKDITEPDFCKQTREHNKEVPILILQKEADLETRLKTLDCGADAVLAEPVNELELKAYLRVLISRSQKISHDEILRVGDLSLNTKTKEASRQKTKISLRRKEYDILYCLMLNKNNVISKEQLLENAWDYGIETFSNTLEVNMKNLRDKIDKPFKKKLIKTVYGFGYKFCAE